MALKSCRECGSKISDRALACPQCGAPQPKKRDAVSSMARVFLIVFLGVPIGIAMISGVLMSDDAGEPKTAVRDEDSRLTAEACALAQDAVRARLKAPSTAKFPGCVFGADKYEIKATPDKGTFWVFGYVDAENSFGAALRNDFGVKLTREGEQWSVVDVQLASK